MITVQGVSRRLAELDDVGVGPHGVNRAAWTEEDVASRAWFERQAEELGLTFARDPAGNLWACPDADLPWWGIGSHLDSVRHGGRFDGPLGVACAFEIAADAPQPVAVISFADEEGARFNTPTFGSKALAGRLDVASVMQRCDDRGIALHEAMRDAGVDPDGILDAPGWLAKLAGFIELHIDQSTDVARSDSRLGIVSSLASRLRLEIDIRGQADHAGTTPRGDRRDALSAAARLVVAGEEISESSTHLTVTSSGIFVEPNAPTTIAARVRLWIDARSPYIAEIDGWLHGLQSFADQLASRSRVEIAIQVASRSPGRELSQPLRWALARASEAVTGRTAPEVVCYAGHDAGVLAERIPAGMILVRNPTGVSHSPEEKIDLQDAVVGSHVIAHALASVVPLPVGLQA